MSSPEPDQASDEWPGGGDVVHVVGAADVADERGRYPVRESTVRYVGAKWSVREETVALPTGDDVVRDLVVHPGSVGVIALDAHERVLLIHQYRHPPGATLWEPPAGLLDEPGEDPLDAIKRELFEEAHHRAGDWRVLLDVFTTPGCSDEAARLYLARDLEPVDEGERHEREHEEAGMPLAWVPLPDAVRHVLDGRFHNVLAVMGILAAQAAHADGFSSLRPADAPWPFGPFPG